MSRSGEGSAVQVVDQRTGSLVAALALAEDCAHGGVEVRVQGVHGLNKVLGSPGAGGQIQILVGSGFLEGVQVHSHAVGGDDQRIFVNFSVGVRAGSHGRGVDFTFVGVVKHIAQVHQIALVTPVGHKTLGTFHDQVGGAFGGDGGVDFVVSVRIG